MKYWSVCLFALLLVSCARKSAPELFEQAASYYQQKEFNKAAQSYEELVARFPGQALAESSFSHLAFLYSGELKDSRKAMDTYRRCYWMFPTSKQAPTMLFLTAFLLNNDLHMIDSAREAYELFLREYPNHELAASARFELETLGKDPGSALGSRVSSAEDSSAPKPKARKR